MKFAGAEKALKIEFIVPGQDNDISFLSLHIIILVVVIFA